MTNSAPQLVPGNFQSCIQEDWVQDKVHSSISFMSLNLPNPWISFVTDFIQEGENSTGSLDYLSLTYLSSFSVGFVCTLTFSPCGWLFSSMNILNFTCHRTFVFTVFFPSGVIFSKISVWLALCYYSALSSNVTFSEMSPLTTQIVVPNES